MIQSDRLRQARQRAHLSQQQLGALIGQDQQYVSKLERAILPGMTVETLERLAHTLDVSTDYLLGRTDPDAPPAVTSTRQETPAPAPAARRKGHARNGTHAAPAPVPASAALPEPARSPAMCPHCYTPMLPMDDGQGMACPGCRYSITGPT
jgi:transcriptional regulator with XRE-family HTH domain